MLCLRQFAFPHNALMLFVCTLDAIFELAPIVRELLGHYIGPARHIATDCRPDVHGLTNPEFMRGHRTSCLGRLFPMCAHASAMQPAPRVSARSSKPQTAVSVAHIRHLKKCTTFYTVSATKARAAASRGVALARTISSVPRLALRQKAVRRSHRLRQRQLG